MSISPISPVSAASFKLQALSGLLDKNLDSTGLFMAAISGISPAESGMLPASGVPGLAANGRNLALNDPESAFSMMTQINGKDVLYKAQFYELSQMQGAISTMQAAAQELDVAPSASSEEVVAQLGAFVERYNGWVQQFGADMRQGGLLADTQAAQVARRELDQSIENIFFGVKDGLHGLKDLGITIDHATGLASFDRARLDMVLATNRQGVVDTVDEFSANFAEAARLLNSDGNFMPRQLDNLDRAIDYIAENAGAWRAEFGTGAAAQPAGQIARALAAYNTMSDVRNT